VNLKTGTGIGSKNFMSSLQFSYVSEQFTDATNSFVGSNDSSNGITGQIPAYYVIAFSTSYTWRQFKFEAGITNITNNSYFTRRATEYPRPGIIPFENRTLYTTLEIKF